MAKLRQNEIGKIRAITIILFLCFVSLCFFFPRFVSKSFNSGANPAATPKPKAQVQKQAQTAQAKFPEFPHNVKAHKIACSSCHKFPTANWKRVRKEEEAFPDVTDYPKHESCLKCHRQQFFGSAKPTICSICHTNPSPRNSARHPFPNPREVFDKTDKGKQHVSDFAISFPHDKHIEIVAQNESPNGEVINAAYTAAADDETGEKSCSVCHQTYQPQGNSTDEFVTKPPEKLGDAFWLKRGTFKTSPVSHAQCFTCHSQDTGILPAPNNCAACHKIEKDELKPDFTAASARLMNADKIMLHAWRSRHSSGTFRHEFSSHADLSCATCHTVAQMNTLDEKTEKVPVLSCAPCHITATADDGGVLNMEIESRPKNPKFECVKCHISFGSQTVPESHQLAIKAQTGN